MMDTPQLLVVAQSSGGSEGGDLVSEVGDEIRVVLDRWSVGQLEVADAVAAAGILLLGGLLAWITSRVSRRIASRQTGAARTAIVMGGFLLASCIMLLTFSVALEMLGFSLGPILVLILVLVIALLLLRPLVTNLSSGLLLQMRGALATGQLVEANGVLGVVTEINARSVVLQTSDGRAVHVPNSKVLNDTIENFDAIGRRRSSFEVMVGPGTSLDEAIAGILAALEPVESVLRDPMPEVQAIGLVGTSAVVRVLVWHAPQLGAEREAVDASVRAVRSAAHDGGLDLDGPDLVAVAASAVPPMSLGGGGFHNGES